MSPVRSRSPAPIPSPICSGSDSGSLKSSCAIPFALQLTSERSKLQHSSLIQLIGARYDPRHSPHNLELPMRLRAILIVGLLCIASHANAAPILTTVSCD